MQQPGRGLSATTPVQSIPEEETDSAPKGVVNVLFLKSGRDRLRSQMTSAKFLRVRANHQYPKKKLKSAKAVK
jgi:hypothetical protein